ncbi:MAG TPA: DUF2335 domain-containing protein [Blastocatellia bacterium]|nr:DUF2335 domain-containing protein [Blastocatellia bacterium]
MSDPERPDDSRTNAVEASEPTGSPHIIRQEVIVKYEAPLPPPGMMEHYERILPGSADRIVTMAEKQSAHRQDIESRVITSNIGNERLGQIFAFILGLIGLIGSIVLASLGRISIGLIMFLAILVSLVAVFIVGRYAQSRERETKLDKLRDALKSAAVEPEHPTLPK